MWIKWCLLAFFGLASGVLVSAGVFALITSIGLIPRMAGKSHTGAYVKKYENAVLFGGILGNILNIFKIHIGMGSIITTAFGLFSGIFVGCLATSLAESLNATAVFARRMKLHTGIGYIVLSVAVGKALASLLYFWLGFSSCI